MTSKRVRPRIAATKESLFSWRDPSSRTTGYAPFFASVGSCSIPLQKILEFSKWAGSGKAWDIRGRSRGDSRAREVARQKCSERARDLFFWASQRSEGSGIPLFGAGLRSGSHPRKKCRLPEAWFTGGSTKLLDLATAHGLSPPVGPINSRSEQPTKAASHDLP